MRSLSMLFSSIIIIIIIIIIHFITVTFNYNTPCCILSSTWILVVSVYQI